MTGTEIKNYIREVLIPRITKEELFLALDKIIDFISSALTNGIPEWEDDLTFNIDGTGAGKFSLYPDINGKLRFWLTLSDGNINHAPPTDPLVTSNAYWEEVSPSSGSAIKEWEPGIFGDGLVIVYFDLNGDGSAMDEFKLTEATRPFHSTDFMAELAAGSWQKLGGPVSSEFAIAGAPIVLDLKHNKEAIFVADAAIGAAKTWTLDHASGGQKLTILFNISEVHDQDFSTDGFKGEKISGDWVGAIWTPPGEGDYEAVARWNGTNWLIKINGPF